jgi:hypothetical protein
MVGVLPCLYFCLCSGSVQAFAPVATITEPRPFTYALLDDDILSHSLTHTGALGSVNLFGNVAFASTGIMPTAPERTLLAW